MSFDRRYFPVAGAVLALIFPTIASAVYAIDVPSTTEIQALTCGLDFAQGSVVSIDYGPLLPNEISTQKDVSFTNTGNTDGTLFIAGTDWKDNTDTTQMLVGATHFTAFTPDQTYEAKAPLGTSSTNFGSLAAGGLFVAYLQLQADLENPGFSGPLQQTVSFSTEC
jgi:hypothetical protein